MRPSCDEKRFEARGLHAVFVKEAPLPVWPSAVKLRGPIGVPSDSHEAVYSRELLVNIIRPRA